LSGEPVCTRTHPYTGGLGGEEVRPPCSPTAPPPHRGVCGGRTTRMGVKSPATVALQRSPLPTPEAHGGVFKVITRMPPSVLIRTGLEPKPAGNPHATHTTYTPRPCLCSVQAGSLLLFGPRVSNGLHSAFRPHFPRTALASELSRERVASLDVSGVWDGMVSLPPPRCPSMLYVTRYAMSAPQGMGPHGLPRYTARRGQCEGS